MYEREGTVSQVEQVEMSTLGPEFHSSSRLYEKGITLDGSYNHLCSIAVIISWLLDTHMYKSDVNFRVN